MPSYGIVSVGSVPTLKYLAALLPHVIGEVPRVRKVETFLYVGACYSDTIALLPNAPRLTSSANSHGSTSASFTTTRIESPATCPTRLPEQRLLCSRSMFDNMRIHALAPSCL